MVKNGLKRNVIKSNNTDFAGDNLIVKRGGSRQGSGRPKLAPTKVLAYRVPISKAIKIDKAIRKLLTGLLL